MDSLGDICRTASKDPFWSLVLFKLVRALRPRNCVEMGTAVGISAAYQAVALRLNGEGRLTTLDGAEALAPVARGVFAQLGVDNVELVVGKFQVTLSLVLAARRPVDFIFVDGHHDESATLNYFEQILPFLSQRAVMVFDDITWSEGMRRAWSRIAADLRLSLVLDLGPVGLCVVDPGSRGIRAYRVPLEST